MLLLNKNKYIYCMDFNPSKTALFTFKNAKTQQLEVGFAPCTPTRALPLDSFIFITQHSHACILVPVSKA